MRTLLIILLLPILLAAQSYSRWNYSDAMPNNAAADAALIASIQAMVSQPHIKEADIYVHIRYTYKSATDSSFEVMDIDDHLIRLFDPTPAPDGATELPRENELYYISKHSPVKTQLMVGGDAMLPTRQAIRSASKETVEAAKLTAKMLRKAVDDSIKAVPSSGYTKAKRAKVWKEKIRQEKAKKLPPVTASVKRGVR